MLPEASKAAITALPSTNDSGVRKLMRPLAGSKLTLEATTGERLSFSSGLLYQRSAAEAGEMVAWKFLLTGVPSKVQEMPLLPLPLIVASKEYSDAASVTM